MQSCCAHGPVGHAEGAIQGSGGGVIGLDHQGSGAVIADEGGERGRGDALAQAVSLGAGGGGDACQQANPAPKAPLAWA